MAEASISAYDKFIIESAEQYLHTVVLIDDRIYESESGSVASRLTKPAAVRRKAALKRRAATTVEKKKESTENIDDETLDEVSFHDVQNSFAKKRIICSLYQPKKRASFGEQSDVYKLCSTADVVVVDWDLHGDSGKNATNLVGTLVEQSMRDIPNQLRLILIYTTDTNLGGVANDIYEGIEGRIGDQFIKPEDGGNELILKTSNSRVVIIGKGLSTHLPQYSNFYVPAKNLAQRTLFEFSQLASGLLQGIVLRGVANLRKNNRRILTRFHKDLDIAFLTHRALSLPDEAFGQIIPLLTDELRAVLEDMLGESPLGKPPAVKGILDDWCDNNWKLRGDAKLKIGDDAVGSEFVKDVFCNGPAFKTDYSQFRGSKITGLVKKSGNGSPEWDEKNCNKHNLAEYLSGDCGVDHCHERLGSLMSQRIRYGHSRRTLHLGVIVKELADKKRYMLCLQPVCDSVRMASKDRAFVFCFLDKATDDKLPTHCVMDERGNLIQLRYKPKVSNISVSNFKGNDDVVYANKDAKGRFVFKGAGEKDYEYEWIAELKTEHAQRAAEQFGRELSRVGLTESEWLRIKAK